MNILNIRSDSSRQNRISQIFLNFFFALSFLLIVSILKVTYMTFVRSKKEKKRASNWLINKEDFFTDNPAIGTKWGLVLYMRGHHKYHMIPLSLLLGILSVFFRKEKLTGRVSSSIYEMN